jgi:hypothetical protein
MHNAGGESSVIIGTLLSQYGGPDKFAWVYDAQKGEYVDMIKAGIVDPIKVVKTALVDASDVASLLTTSDACVVDAPEEDKPAVGGGMRWYGRHGRHGWILSYGKVSLHHLLTCPRSLSSFPTPPYLHNCYLYTHSQYSPLRCSTLSTMVSDFCSINDIFELILCVRIYRQVVRLRSYHRPCSIRRDDTR